MTYAELTTPLLRGDVVATGLSVLSAAGFPTTSWQSTSVPRGLLEFDAEVLVQLSASVAALAAAGVLAAAEGDLLTVLALDAFDEARKPAVVARGTVTLTESAGSPHAFAAGELVLVSSADPTVVYRNDSSVSLSSMGSASAAFSAESPGGKYDVQGSTLSLATPVPGVSMSAASGTSWLTQEGEDEESDASLRDRCSSKWATLASTGSYDSYRYWAKSVSGVTRVAVQEMPGSDPTAGDPAVLVVVAGSTGAADPTAFSAAIVAVQLHRPLGVLVEVRNATEVPITPRGTYKVKAAYATAAQPLVNAAVKDYVNGLDVGLGAVLASQLVEDIMAVPGVVDCTLTDGSGVPYATGALIASTAGDEVIVLSGFSAGVGGTLAQVLA